MGKLDIISPFAVLGKIFNDYSDDNDRRRAIQRMNAYARNYDKIAKTRAAEMFKNAKRLL